MQRLAAVICLITAPALAQADLLALKAGAAAWMPDGSAPGFNAGEEQQFSLKAAFEHPIPIIPNIKLRYWDYAEKDGDRPLELTTTDAILYYEILDNPVVDLDLGISATYLQDGRASGQRGFEGWLPQAYGAARVPLLGTGFGAYGEATATNWEGSSAYDLEAGLDYKLDMPVLDLSLRLGYRQVENDFDDFDDYSGTVEFKGWSMGVLLDI